MQRRLFTKTASLMLIIALSVTACRGGAVKTPKPAGPIGGTLVVYSGRSEELVGPLIEQFEEETGVTVDARYGGSSEMAATLLTEGADSPADVFFSQDPGSLGAIADLTVQLPESLRSLVPERFRDPEGRWVGTTARSRVLAYNPELVAENEIPTSYKELTGPKWSGRVGIAPTNASFVLFVAAMILLEGEHATLEWLTDLAANDPVEFDGNSPIAAAVDTGDISVGLINHYYLLQLGAEQGGTTAVNRFFGAADAGSLVMPAGVSILSTASNPEAAEAFIEFLLSAESQAYFAETIFEYPVVKGAPAPAGAPPIDTLASPEVSSTDLATMLDRATDLISASGLL